MQYVTPVDFAAFPKNEFHSQVLADRSTGLDSCICILTRVPQGTSTKQGPHTHAADQFYFVLSGTSNVQIGDQRFEVPPMHLVYIPAGVPHYNWNEREEDELHFEWIAPSPPRGEPVYTAVPKAAGSVARTDLVRRLDEDALAQGERWSQVNIADRASGVESVSVGVFRMPQGQLTRLHVHRFDQIYYIISGRMQVQIGFETYSAGPNSLVVLPAGMPHQNWNDGPEAEFHLNLRVPQPENPDIRTWDLPVTIGEPREP